MASKNEYIYQLIRDKLFTGLYPFGSAISVKELSNESGISRQPIMTALYRLKEHGFVDITAQVGCNVIDPELQEIMDFYLMFAAIEGVIAKMAAERSDSAGVRDLLSINHQILSLDMEMPSVEQEYRRLNIRFHIKLHELAKSPLVCQKQQANFDLSDFYLVQTGSFRKNMECAGKEHEQIINAIKAHDSNEAQHLAQTHLLSVANHIRDGWQ